MTEAQHRPNAKAPYRATNRVDAASQMIRAVSNRRALRLKQAWLKAVPGTYLTKTLADSAPFLNIEAESAPKQTESLFGAPVKRSWTLLSDFLCDPDSSKWRPHLVAYLGYVLDKAQAKRYQCMRLAYQDPTDNSVVHQMVRVCTAWKQGGPRNGWLLLLLDSDTAGHHAYNVAMLLGLLIVEDGGIEKRLVLVDIYTKEGVDCNTGMLTVKSSRSGVEIVEVENIERAAHVCPLWRLPKMMHSNCYIVNSHIDRHMYNIFYNPKEYK